MPGFTERNGWKLFKHPAFGEPYNALIKEVEQLKVTRPEDWEQHPKVKLLASIQTLIYDEIPQDPSADKYQQGNTLGSSHRHWRRAKFPQRFRLFFRYDSKSKIIIYAWVNDENTLRQAGGRSDPYIVFEKRLKKGDPPTDWDDLLKQSAP